MDLQESWGKVAKLGANGIFDVSIEDHLISTSQNHLPQARVIIDALNHLQKNNLQEAYLRGSFSSGEADIHSDIDMFLVVEPENLEATFNSFHQHLKDNYNVIVECHDKLVTDYGGIGFMFLCQKPGEKPFQFDLYLAMKGISPKANLYDCPRIYSSDPAYCWVDENRQQPELPLQTRTFIDRYTKNQSREERAEQMFKDVMIALFIMNKHVNRHQFARALNDNNHTIAVCVNMMMDVLNKKTYHSPLYAADKLLKSCRESGDPALALAARRLESTLRQPPSQRQVTELYNVAKTLITEFFPEIRTRNEFAMARFESFIKPQAEKPASDAVLKAG